MKTRNKKRTPPPAATDFRALPFVHLPDPGPWDLERLMDFDRMTCRVFKAFVRPATAADHPIPHTPTQLVMVREVGPGIRMRLQAVARLPPDPRAN